MRQYQDFLDTYPVMRADYSLRSDWLGPPRTLVLPGFHRRFDWALEHTDWAHRNPQMYVLLKRVNQSHLSPEHQRRLDPRAVFAAPFALRRILDSAIRTFPEGRADRRVLVLAGSDQLLSDAFGGSEERRLAVAEVVQRYFGAVFYEAKDVEVPGVRAMPIGLSEHYLRQPGAAESAAQAIRAADLTMKPGGVLLAGGGFSDFSDEAAADTFGDLRGLATVNRKEAHAWAASAAGRAAGVDVRRVDRGSWWGELAKYRFLMSPWGDGVQSPKAIEALLVLTIPVVMRGTFPVFDEMRRLGFPLVVLDAWSDITRHNLDTWWRALSPRLRSFRDNCLNTTGYWRLVTGNQPRCG